MPSRLAVISFLDEPGSPNYPSQGPGFPSQGLPGIPPYPSQGLPGFPGLPNQGLPGGPVHLPVYPFDPTRPDNSLPGTPGSPSQGPGFPTQPIAPGGRFIVKWLACVGLILVPDNSLPPTAEPR
jgi:hypothetical protein